MFAHRPAPAQVSWLGDFATTGLPSIDAVLLDAWHAPPGNTLLNYAGVKPDLLPLVCDAAPAKQGQYLPGSHIPILPPAALRERRPDWVLILPWNLREEVMEQVAFIRDWGGRFVMAVPRLEYVM